MATGTSVKACALKTLQFNTPAAIAQAHNELGALKTAQGKPHLVQGVAAIKFTNTAGLPSLCIATE